MSAHEVGGSPFEPPSNLVSANGSIALVAFLAVTDAVVSSGSTVTSVEVVPSSNTLSKCTKPL